MKGPPYSLEHILRSAKHHPFYNQGIRFPPPKESLVRLLELEQSEETERPKLDDFPVITKNELFTAISRLISDESLENSYRHHCYATITGGGFKLGVPLLWLTDSSENRYHRAAGGELVKTVGIIEPTDLVLNLHVSGNFYRSLDMTTDILEHAGATVLPAGSDISSERAMDAILQYRVTCLAGPVSELVRIALFISTLHSDSLSEIRIRKLFYTSEPISVAQQAFLVHIFGPVPIYSGLGSAEIGFWGVGNPILTGVAGGEDARDYIFDTRNMLVEILSTENVGASDPCTVPEGTPGLITVTSLQRLRNPLVRYMGGDIGSVHSLPTDALCHLSPADRKHYRVIRMFGRDPRFTFTWKSHKFDYEMISSLVTTPGWNILQWQMVVGTCSDGEQLEVRLLRGRGLDGEIPESNLVGCLEHAFLADDDPFFSVSFLRDFSAFERSGTGQKVIRFVDKRDSSPGK